LLPSQLQDPATDFVSEESGGELLRYRSEIVEVIAQLEQIDIIQFLIEPGKTEPFL
jgi:hypothetical protein